ncbi:hypothetical protein ACNKHW_01000 [Shigella flexneri]
MIQRDPELSGGWIGDRMNFMSVSSQADLALALLLYVQQGLRDDLKLLIMSATLDALLATNATRSARRHLKKGARFRFNAVIYRCPRISVLTEPLR